MKIDVFSCLGNYCFDNIDDFNKFISEHDERCIVRCESIEPLTRINNRELAYLSDEELKSLKNDIGLNDSYKYFFEIQSKKFYTNLYGLDM